MTGPLTPSPDCFAPSSPEGLGESYKAVSGPDSLSVTMSLGDFTFMSVVGAATVDYFFDEVCTEAPLRWEYTDILMHAFICSTYGFDFGTPYLSYYIFPQWTRIILYSGYIKCADALEGVPLPNNGGGQLCGAKQGDAMFSGGSLTAVYA
jgi:hypothetical protein